LEDSSLNKKGLAVACVEQCRVHDVEYRQVRGEVAGLQKTSPNPTGTEVKPEKKMGASITFESVRSQVQCSGRGDRKLGED